MASFNQCTFVGNLGSDPEMRYLASGDGVCNFRIACSESWKNKDGEKQERTEWVSIVVFGKLAEVCSEYLRTGKQVLVQGRLQTRKWTDKEGNDRYSTEIVADTMKMLGRKEEDGAGSDSGSKPATQPARQAKPATATKNPTAEDLDDDIPF